MRKRWIAGIFAVPALIWGVTSASQAQRPERRLTTMPTAAPGAGSPWRSKTAPKVSGESPSTVELAPGDPEVAAATRSGPVVEDPMAAVDSFLRRNRKEADDSIQALTREAEALRARLARVDAALARWQAVAGALNPGQKWGQPDPPAEAGPDLAPIDPAPSRAAGVKEVIDPPTAFPGVPIGSPAPVSPAPGTEAPPTLPGPPPTSPTPVPPPGPGGRPEPN